MELIGKVHIVPIMTPVDTTTAAPTTDIVGLLDYNHVTFIIHVGAVDGTCVVTVEECTTAAGASNDAIGFKYREMVTTDTWGTLTTVATADAATGFTIADDDDNHLFAIEVDAADLTDTHPYVDCVLAAPSTGANLYSIIAILSEPRYMKDIPISGID